MQRFLPFLGWWAGILKPRILQADLIAGGTVACVAVPQALAYAQLAGMPPVLGLYAAFLPAIMGALFGSCAQLSTGPVALTSMLTAAGLSSVAPIGSAEFVQAAIVLALLSGTLQWALGLLRCGRFFNLLPEVVLKGFVAAAAALITLSQLPDLLGFSGPSTHTFEASLIALWHGLPSLQPAAALFGVLALIFLQQARSRLSVTFPAALLVLAASIALSSWLGFETAGGRVVGDTPSGLPTLVVPAFDLHLVLMLLPLAAVIAAVSFLEALSSARTIAQATGEPWNVNQELIGQGLAKCVAALSQSFPVSGSFSRSALNYGANARTAWSQIFCALLVAAVLMFFASALHSLPRAVLAALIILAVSGLISPQYFTRLAQTDERGFATALVTFSATLGFAPNIHYGIGVGLIAGWALRLR